VSGESAFSLPLAGGVMHVAVAGDACVDVYGGADGQRGAVGGNALNVAIGLARRGLPAAFFGVVGDDENASHIRLALREAGVSEAGVRLRRGPTWVAFIALHNAGTAVVEREQLGVAGPYKPTRAELEALAGYGHVHLANLANPKGTLDNLIRRGVSASYDWGVLSNGSDFARVQFAFCSCADGDPEAAERLARCAVGHGARVAIVLRGAAGSLAFDGNRVVSVPGAKIDPIDTLGAGDSYIAAFLANTLRGASLEVAMAAATEAATRTCLHWAAWPQQPLDIATGSHR
jgi:fructoselysine 6-kinase